MYKILNLYAGIGGNRKLWKDVEVTAVEINSEIAAIYQDFFPDDKVVVGDAHQYLLDHYKEFDFIWSSPPCPTHSTLKPMGVMRGQNKAVYPDMALYQEIILLKRFHKLGSYFVVENVKPYYKPLISATVELHRHLFWTNFYIPQINIKDERKHQEIVGSTPVYGFDLKKYDGVDRRKCLRNMVNPEVAKYILNTARNIQEPMQEGLFNNL